MNDASKGVAAHRQLAHTFLVMPERLHARQLVKTYSRRVVVDNVSLDLGRGEIVGLLGPNGAGKTTTFRMAIGLIHPDAGEIRLDDTPITRWPMYRRCRAGVGYLAQEPSVFRGLTVAENLIAVLEHLNLTRRKRQQRRDQLLESVGLEHLAAQRADRLSGGERRRLEIARCLATSPSFLLMDEPFSGIDPKAVAEIQRIIGELCRAGIGILVTDHNWRETLAVTQRAYIIGMGKVICHGNREQIMTDQRVRDVYLGESRM